MPPDKVSPFSSFVALRAEHSRLLKARASREQGANPPTEAEITDFLARSRVTGRRLDSPSERDAAQSAMDYWTATLYTLLEKSPQAPELAGKATDAHALLEPFDQKS